MLTLVALVCGANYLLIATFLVLGSSLGKLVLHYKGIFEDQEYLPYVIPLVPERRD